MKSKRLTLQDRAINAADRFAEAQHGKPKVHEGRKWWPVGYFPVRLAYAAGWLAGYRARRDKL